MRETEVDHVLVSPGTREMGKEPGNSFPVSDAVVRVQRQNALLSERDSLSLQKRELEHEARKLNKVITLAKEAGQLLSPDEFKEIRNKKDGIKSRMDRLDERLRELRRLLRDADQFEQVPLYDLVQQILTEQQRISKRFDLIFEIISTLARR